MISKDEAKSMLADGFTVDQVERTLLLSMDQTKLVKIFMDHKNALVSLMAVWDTYKDTPHLALMMDTLVSCANEALFSGNGIHMGRIALMEALMGSKPNATNR